MADKIQKTLEIRAEYSQALDGIAKYRMELDRVKKEAKSMTDTLKNLDKQLKEGSISEEEHSKAVMETQKQLAANKQEQQQYADAIRTTERVVRNQITQQNEAQDSLKAMRAQLANLTKEYDEMSRAAREGAEGIEQLEAINNLTDKIKEAEEATQRFQRNVGNYTNSVEEALQRMGMTGKMEITQIVSTGNSAADAFLNMATGAEGLKGAMAVAGQAVQGLIKQFLALIATPVGATLAVIAAAYNVVTTAIEKDEQASQAWQRAIAPLRSATQVWENSVVKAGKAIIDMLNPIISITARLGAFYDAVIKSSSAVEKLGGAFLSGGWRMMQQYLESLDEGVQSGMKWAETLPVIGNRIAENNKRIADNNKIAEENIRLTEEQRKMTVEHSEIEMKVSDLRAKAAQKDKYDANERKIYLEEAIALEKRMSNDRVRIAQDRLNLMRLEAAQSSNNEEVNDALAEAQANVNRETTNYNNKLRELNAQLAEFTAQEQAEKAALDAAAKAREDAVKAQLATEESLWRQYEDTLIALIKDGYEKQKQVTATQYQREIEDLQNQLANEKDLTESAREAINLTIIAKRQQMHDAIKEIDQQATDEQIQRDAEILQSKAELERLTMENRLAALQENTWQYLEMSKEKTALEYELRQQAIEMEHQQEMERINQSVSDEAQKNELLLLEQEKYNQRRLENDQKQSEAQKQIAMAEKQMKLNAYNSVKSGIDAMAQHSKAFAVMSKTIALAEIAINTGKAIAAGVSQAMSVPFPANLIAIATTVATVLANVATAISTVKSAKFAKGGKVEDKHRYASGGNVRGAGTGTSDSIHAMLSNGESVMTAAATSMYAPILSVMNQSAGGNPIGGTGSGQGEDMLTRAMARAMMMMPAPVVSVEEINTTSRRVEVLENLASV